MAFPFYKQYDSKDCGPACLMMITKYFGRTFSFQFFREKCQITRQGVSLLGISKAAEAVGCKTLSAKITFEELLKSGLLPCIVHWKQSHFLVVYKITKKSVYIADPAKGLIKLPKSEFLVNWQGLIQGGISYGIVLFIEPTEEFEKGADIKQDEGGLKFGSIASYFVKYRQFFFQLIISFAIGSGLQLIVPFLTQAIVDVGIGTGDKNFIMLILLGQVVILIGSTVVDFTRNWIILHVSTRINISLLSHFFIKLMRLPVAYFDNKHIGDIMQRMGDHARVQSFLTNTVLSLLFSIINFAVYTVIIITYDSQLFAVFIAGSLLYFGWILLFLRTRKSIDYQRFDIASKSQSNTIQIIQGMQEIKLSNSEIVKRWQWERLQARSFKIQLRSLTINQIQQAGALFINQGKNVMISFMTATKVIDGELTLGGMIAIQFIMGQLNGPMQQFIQFSQSLQDAKISLDRINEIHALEPEEPAHNMLVTRMPSESKIELCELNFRYPGFASDNVLNNINLVIPEGKTTAIVGMSGSGKTTLIKLLLKFYDPTSGNINVGNIKLSNISHSFWRSQCGVVMQDGYIFSASIAENIAAGDEYPDLEKIMHAVDVANIRDFIDSLPLGFNTIIGAEGSGISQGQKQRILIARAVYKDPPFVFFDEATNALDANNEAQIMQKFTQFFTNRTVVIVAHRLSTVKKADQIIVLNKGRIAESGTHDELISLKRDYFNLVKNQLELGN